MTSSWSFIPQFIFSLAFSGNGRGDHLVPPRIVNSNVLQVKVKVVGKAHPIRDHEGPEVEQRNSSTLSLTSTLDGVGG